MTAFWQAFEPYRPLQELWQTDYVAEMPGGTGLRLPLRDMGDFAVAGLIANQASFAVLDQVAAWLAEAARPLGAEIVVGLPTLGHTVGAATARALGHANWVAPSTTRKRWYDDALSVPLASITSPALGANLSRRMWLDPRMRDRLRGLRVALVDDVISTGTSAQAGLALLRAVGIEPVAVLVAMVQGDRWAASWDHDIPVIGAFSTPRFERNEGGWRAVEASRLSVHCPLELARS